MAFPTSLSFCPCYFFLDKKLDTIAALSLRRALPVMRGSFHSQLPFLNTSQEACSWYRSTAFARLGLHLLGQIALLFITSQQMQKILLKYVYISQRYLLEVPRL